MPVNSPRVKVILQIPGSILVLNKVRKIISYFPSLRLGQCGLFVSIFMSNDGKLYSLLSINTMLHDLICSHINLFTLVHSCLKLITKLNDLFDSKSYLFRWKLDDLFNLTWCCFTCPWLSSLYDWSELLKQLWLRIIITPFDTKIVTAKKMLAILAVALNIQIQFVFKLLILNWYHCLNRI